MVSQPFSVYRNLLQSANGYNFPANNEIEWWSERKAAYLISHFLMQDQGITNIQ
jgi:hypothetical protein